jgi:hypothetical protein
MLIGVRNWWVLRVAAAGGALLLIGERVWQWPEIGVVSVRPSG